MAISEPQQRLMDNVLTITRKNNCDDFRLSLIETVMALQLTEALSFQRPVRGRGGEFLVEDVGARRNPAGGWAFNADSIRRRSLSIAARRALTEHEPTVEFDTASGERIHYVPVVIEKRPPELVQFSVRAEDSGDTQMMLAFCQLYRNFLSIISDGERDALTGLLNRKTLETSLRRILEQHTIAPQASVAAAADKRRQGSGDYWLGVLDIDHFKRINDGFGHLYGDEVLLLVAQIMQRCFRSDDLLFRYGGEEFVVVLAPTSKPQALNAFERLRRTVESHVFPQVGQITVSIGIVRFDRQGLPSIAVGHADQALYYAKAQGRNRVYCYEDLINSGAIARPESHSSIELF